MDPNIEQRVKLLIRKRAPLISKLTRFETFIERPSEELDKEQTKSKIAKLERTLENFEIIQPEIEALVSESQLEIEYSERADFEDSVSDNIARARKLIQCIDLGNVSNRAQNLALSTNANLSLIELQNQALLSQSLTANSDTVANSHDNALSNASRNDSHIKLPAMHLPQFGGSYESWPGFSDSFKSAVHDNPSFRDTQKLIYLRSCLSGKALEKIESLETTAANYQVAL